jgi:hypothetical protein
MDSARPHTGIEKARFHILPLLLLAAIGVFVVRSQNHVVGFEPGYDGLQPGHHGWVSSHTLAIISHATPENRFVGYATASLNAAGQIDYDYFDRYPVFFSVAMHYLLALTPKLSTQFYFAKQIMNAIYMATMLAAYLLLYVICQRRLAALTATILSMSSGYLLFYKDMVHYDQPALLGMLLLMLAIALAKFNGPRWIVYPATIVAVSLGRGYASFSVLLVWLVVDAVRQWRASQHSSIGAHLAEVLRLDASRASLIGAGWGSLCLGYNVAVEASTRGLQPGQTSIIQSALNRLSLNPAFDASYPTVLNLRQFLSDQLIRIIRWSFPLWNYHAPLLINLAILLAMLAITFRYWLRLEPAKQDVLLILLIPGFPWLLAMRNLSAFHDYTAMYYLGLALAFYLALFSQLHLPTRPGLMLLAIVVDIFLFRNLAIQDLHQDIGQPYSTYTYDMITIASKLPPGNPKIHWVDSIPYAPYAPGYYLPSAIEAPLDRADYVIAHRDDYQAENLTKQNGILFLFPK